MPCRLFIRNILCRASCDMMRKSGYEKILLKEGNKIGFTPKKNCTRQVRPDENNACPPTRRKTPP